ncbi:MAG: MATE family efflux transporter [Syntrophomonadaceae bacterium]|nr:MATE family efflux transporter [Syntrophomonadaceae bacterium]MDD4550227.1 MATE family efflux transporter [Syntrophomonadaceae bacterium]
MLIFRNAELRKRILKIAIPAMTEMVLYMLVGVVDIAIVGRLGATSLAAVGLGAEIFFAIILFLAGLGIGSSILVAQAKGAGRMDYASQVAGQTFILGLLIGLLTGALGLTYSDYIISLFGVEESVYTQAVEYLLIVFKVAPLALTLYMIEGIFRGLGRTDIPMKIAIVQNIINGVGDYLLVFGVLGFPALGVAGAAWATLIAHVVGFILGLWFLIKGQQELKVKFKSLFALRFPVVKDITRLGFPSLTEEFFITGASLVSMFFITVLGTISFAAHEVAVTVESLSFMPGFGIGMTATALVGQAIGAKNRTAVYETARGCTELGLLLMGLIGVLFAVFPCQIAAIFTNDPELIETAGTLVRLAALEQITIAFSIVAGGILKGTGDTRTPMLVTTFFTWVFRLPLMYLFVYVFRFNLTYIWLMFITDWFLRSIVYLVIILRANLLRKPEGGQESA